MDETEPIPVEPPAGAPGPDAGPNEASGRRRIVLIVAAVAVVALVAIGAAIALGNDGDDGDTTAGTVPVAGGAVSSTTTDPKAAKTTTTKPRDTKKPRTTTTVPAPPATEPAVGTVPGTTPAGGPGGGTTAAGTGGASPRFTAPPILPDPTPASVTKAYSDAWIAACRRIWTYADGDGVLIDFEDPAPQGKRPLIVDDCTSLLDPEDAVFYDNVADARVWGRDDAYDALDDIMVGRRLRNSSGTRTWVSPLSGGPA